MLTMEYCKIRMMIIL